jgi:hypothetical protein
MITVERLIQQIRADKWAELEAIDKKYSAIESRLGFPPKKRYRCISGRHNTDTLIVERQWESMAALEAAWQKALSDPERKALGTEMASIVESEWFELLWPMP